jgi:hydroxymethylbilane synthase
MPRIIIATEVSPEPMRVKSETSGITKIRLGTRGSPLALTQAGMVRAELAKIDPKIAVEVRIIKTSGDWAPEHGEVRLSTAEGGKGLFAKELEKALLEDEIDIAVHSMKDMEVQQPDGLIIPFMLPREDVRDVFISNVSQNIEGLPQGAVVGTASVRRAAFVLARRPDLKTVPLRGNVQTRLDKLHAGQVDATLLAAAGLKRLGLLTEAQNTIAVTDMIPAVGQGAVGIELRKADMQKLSIIGQFSCEKTVLCVNIERAVLRALGGSCHTPVGVHAAMDGEDVFLMAQLLSPDGQHEISINRRIPISDVGNGDDFGAEAGRYLRARAPQGALDAGFSS